MRTKAVLIGIGTISLFVLTVCLAGRFGSGPASALASVPPDESYWSHQVPALPGVPGLPACGPNWDSVSSPDNGQEDDLAGVAAVSANDVWAVG
jgi:hypothetical protein